MMEKYCSKVRKKVCGFPQLICKTKIQKNVKLNLFKNIKYYFMVYTDQL